jgi:hypothetical protein
MTMGQTQRASRVVAALAAAVGMILALVAATVSTPPVAAAQKEKVAPAPPGCRLKEHPTDAGAIAPGISACRLCHTGADKGQAAGYVTKYKSNEFVLLNEAPTWDQKDVHSIAFANLSGTLGQKMEKNLGYKVTEAPQCLTCHSVDLHPDVPLKDKKLDGGFATAETGVNCTACHGLGRNWQFDHYEEPLQKGQPLPWRTKDPQYKFNRGMHDLRNPAIKARLCASCHVGCAEEGKIVTHEMYAAGHPPLPPFELASFMESEPLHWGHPTDKRLAFFKTFAEKNPDKTWPIFHYHPAEKEIYLARNIASGAIASLDAELRLLAADAAIAADPKAEGGMDFARFDCYACHHDLKYPSDRQARGYEGAPGRPPLKAWVGALSEIVATHAEGLENPELKALASAFAPKWEAVRKAALARPFGHPDDLRKASDELAAWCDAFLKHLGDSPAPIYTPEQSSRLLDLISAAATSPKWAADPEAAMNLTWAYLTLREDLNRAADPEKVEALDMVIATRVRSPEHYMDKDKMRPMPIESYLRPRMKKFATFDADSFSRAFLDVAGMK